ncbi:Pisatin demethylase [Madurella mycetomatis]|uniref:Pisatin demethylase n=1 Tax=Madurella mycetomatis TaxID=100816 RepID=A0A175WJC6_9PEZI|nr:Pisatin demethylase [Madurella mycetomatis]
MALAVASLGLTALAAAVVGYVIFSILYQIIYYRFFHPLAQFPGPFWGSVTRLWLTYQDVRGRESAACDAQFKKHGVSAIRITPTMILINDATKIPLIYHRFADKTQHYITGSIGPVENIFNMQDHHTHARYRKFAASPYSFTNVKKMEPLIDERIEYWLSRVDTLFASTKAPFDFSPWASYMAYDVISEVGFGECFGFVEQGRDVNGLIRSMHDGVLPFGIMARMYPLTRWLKGTWLKRYLVATPQHKGGFGAMLRVREELVARRLRDIEEGKKPRVDLLQTFLDARDENGQPLDLEYVKAEIMLILIAGADTTSTTLQALIQFALTHPPAYQKLLAEIDAATKAGKLSNPVPRYEEVVENCPYYVACIRETMRLLPSTPCILPRLVSKGGIEIDGKYIPEGAEVSANPRLVHRDKNIYGEDAGEFKPERWLESEEQMRQYLKYSMSFGYGSRACLGVHVAHMELYKAPLLFFRTFKVMPRNVEKPARYRVVGGLAFFEDFWLTIERRDS